MPEDKRTDSAVVYHASLHNVNHCLAFTKLCKIVLKVANYM